MAERTLQVENRIRNGEAVVASGRTHRDIIAPEIAARVEELSEADVKRLFDGLCGSLERVSDVLAVAEDRHVAELADDGMPKSARDAAVAEIIKVYQRVRSRVDGALGSAGLARYGLESPATRTPHALASRVESAIKLMRKDPVDLDDGLGAPVPIATIADALAAALAPLTAALQTLRVEDRENEGAMTARDRAIDEWTVVYQGVATILTGLYRMAGRDDLADRIRPTERRASGIERSEPEPVVTDAGA